MARISRFSPERRSLPASAALLIFGPPQALDDPEGGETNAARLLAAWRAGGGPVIHVQQHSRGSSQGPGRGFRDEVRPRAGEFVIEATTRDAFADTGLAPFLAERGVDTLVIAGGVTNVSLAATLRGAGDLGYRAFPATDATATAAVLEAR